MPKINLTTLVNGWAAELGRVSVFPSPDYFCESGPGPYDFESRTLTLMAREGMTREAAAARARQDSSERNRTDPTFTLRTNEQNALVAQPVYGRTRPTIEMARFIGSKRHAKNAVVLMNGDGFDLARLTTFQTAIRSAIQSTFREITERMIIPYQALTSAGLDLDTILPIHISGDKTVSTVVKVPMPPMKVLMEWEPTSADRRRVFVWNDLEYQSHYQHPHAPGTKVDPHYHINWVPEFSTNRSWHAISLNAKTGEWMVTEQVHRLGSSVFSAVGPDGKRHRWVSSFDQNENPPMYFLAQLPDHGGVRYLGHALKLLAPDIVHKARSEGRRVFRQGDIFFVETKMTDEDFASERIAHRRAVFVYPETPSVLQNMTYVANTTFASSSYTMVPSQPQGTHNIVMPAVSLGPNDSTAWVGNTNINMERPAWEIRESALKDLKARRSIMLYGTGHTASLVIQTKDRGTFVKGIVYHDPVLENIRGGREPEHRPLRLTEGKWFLCVRNTVPRVQPTPTEGEATNGTTGNDPVPGLQGNVRQRRRVSERRLPVGAASGNS